MSTFAELKRRNIFRMALLYLVAGWLILQLSAALFHHLGIPDWAFRFTFALLLICFPLVMVFSWIFEITPEGLKHGRKIEAQASITTQTGQRITRITMVLMTLAILTFIVDKAIPGIAPEEVTKSIMEPLNQTMTTDGPVHSGIYQGIDLQGHRGARGLLPENTIPAFLHALELGVTTLEMDTAINAQGHVVVSHEPWMSAKICSHKDGRQVSAEEEKTLRIYAMSDRQVASFDCGSRGHPDYPRQRAIPVSKPLLDEVFRAVAKRLDISKRGGGSGEVLFNIEIKSLPEGDRVFHPEVKEFASALYKVVQENDVVEQTTIQSFDPRALEAMHEIDPYISTSLIVENSQGLKTNLDRLSFTPQIYSPYYKLLVRAEIDKAHAQGIKVIPWTINDKETMLEMLELGVDGLITDYPDLGVEVLAEIQKD